MFDDCYRIPAEFSLSFYLQTIERILMYYFKCNEFESGE